jgi:hypothetical protein
LQTESFVVSFSCKHYLIKDKKMKKELGKISFAKVGKGGYQGVMFGFSIGLASDIYSCADFYGFWDYETEIRDDTAWTEQDRQDQFAATMKKISETIRDAKVESVSELVGKPVEVIFDGNKMVSWRVLKEVL